MKYEIEALVAQYSERLLRYATSIMYDYHEAEDIVQDVFMTAHAKMATFDGENLSAWLYKITYHKCLNRLKRRKVLPFAEVPIPEIMTVADNGLSETTLRTLAKLKPQERALLYGRIIEEYSYDELALQMGMSAATIRKRYERTKKKFIELSGGSNEFGELDR